MAMVLLLCVFHYYHILQKHKELLYLPATIGSVTIINKRIKSFLGFRGCTAASLRPRENARHCCVHGGTKAREDIDSIFLRAFLFCKKGVTNVAWIYLVIAGIFEVVWAVALKYTMGFTRLVPSIITVFGAIASFYFLSMATKTLPIGTAYAVWTGIGAVGAVIIGMLFLNEPINASRMIFLLLILVGLVGLKLTSGH
jgi:quaternary ammonium compound-resistance protein SugE